MDTSAINYSTIIIIFVRATFFGEILYFLTTLHLPFTLQQVGILKINHQINKLFQKQQLVNSKFNDRQQEIK